MTSRRVFLKNGAFALVSLGFAPSFLTRTAFAAGAPRRARQLIAIFQRGGVDGLNVIVPYGEAEYYRARASIAIARPRIGMMRRSISTASSASIRGSVRCSRSGIIASSPSFTRAVLPTRLARISTPRTSWRRQRPASRARRMAG